MSNRKRVTLTFEIDDHDGFNDEAYMRRDFLQELSCCVNNPYEDTFMMKVEGAHEMSAVEYLRTMRSICENGRNCGKCPISYNNNGKLINCQDYAAYYPEEAVAVIKRYVHEHPEERNE